MEGGRIRSSVALPREVGKPTVIEDNGEKIALKTGQQIFVNLVSLLHHQNRDRFMSYSVHCSRYPQATTPRHGQTPNRSASTAI